MKFDMEEGAEKPTFTAPILSTTIIGLGEMPTGAVTSISLLIEDANRNLFSLHVETEDNYRANEEGPETLEPGETREPVFMVPSDTLTIETVEDIVNGIKPSILSIYLVAQDQIEETQDAA